jgi:DNA polymerase III subunit chi
MTDIWFYHLVTRSLEQVLPSLIEKARERDWSVVVQCQDEARRDMIDQLLWTYEPASFLAHGSERDGDGAQQPIWLTCGTDTPNHATIRFMIDGSDILSFVDMPDAQTYERIICLFNGNDEDELSQARAQWKALKDKGASLSYFQQNEEGRWEKKA